MSVSKLRSLSASHNGFHSNSTRSYLPIFMYVAKKNVALTIPFPFPMYLVSKTQHRQLVLFVVRIIFSNHPDTFSTWIIRIRGRDIVANFNVSCQIPNTWLYRQNIYVCMFQMKNDLLTMKNKEKEKLSRGSQWGSSIDL